MSIVSSTTSLGHPQIDGRRYATVTHTDHLGGKHLREYLAAANANHAAIALAQAAQVEIELAEAEANALLG